MRPMGVKLVKKTRLIKGNTMKILASSLILLATLFCVTQTASAQQFTKDYITFQGQHPTSPNHSFIYVLMHTTVPAHLGRDRDGLLIEITTDQFGKPIASDLAEYKLRGTPLSLTVYRKSGAVEIGQFNDNNQYRILEHSGDRQQVGKAIPTRPCQLEGQLKEFVAEFVRDLRSAEVAATYNNGIVRALQKANDKFARKIGL